MHWLSAYPIATVSSAAFYLLLLAYCVPKWRGALSPLFRHPVSPHQNYLLGFDSIRGLAAAYVAIAHCWWATYPVFASTQLHAGWLGFGTKAVCIFAVLSGFLIFRSVLGGLQSIDRLRDYALRRFFRIYPVYLLSVILCLIVGQYVSGPHVSTVSYFTSDLFMFYAFSWAGGFANPPAWSLYIEIIFYAFLPMMAIAVPRRLMIPFCGFLICALILADYDSRVFGLWKYFLVGIIASEVAPRLWRRAAWPLFGLGLALLYIDFKGPAFDWVARLNVGRLHGDTETIGLALACGFILTALPSLPTVGRILNIAPLRMIGIISYSVYLTHFFYIKANFPEIDLFRQLGTPASYEHFKSLPAFSTWYLPLVFFPGVFVWGAISFLLVERPGIRLGQYLIERRRRIAAVAAPPMSQPQNL
jgi:peptidoglycan/LPS O-acetylase OafA/YrhL